MKETMMKEKIKTTIPVINAGDKVPDGPCYMLARDGYYLRKSNRLFDAVVKIAALPDFDEVAESVKWNAPKIPSKIIDESLEFFRAVHDEHKSEAIVLLAFDRGSWSIVVPEQKVSPASLKYECPAGANLAGTIHSHCGMGAFFSGTDTNDVANFDGVHIVLGRIDRREYEIEVGVYVNGRLFKGEPGNVIEGYEKSKRDEGPHPWIEKVTCLEDRFEGFVPEMHPFEIGPPSDDEEEEFECHFCPLCGEDQLDRDDGNGEAECGYCGCTFKISNIKKEEIPRWKEY